MRKPRRRKAKFSWLKNLSKTGLKGKQDGSVGNSLLPNLTSETDPPKPTRRKEIAAFQKVVS